MQKFTPFSTSAPLPTAKTQEGQVLEFKARLNRADGGAKINYPELAKDLAAFANAFGGTILVGAREAESGVLDRYDPLDAGETAETRTAYIHAGEAWCFPRVAVDLVPVAEGVGTVLAVNVDPRLDSVVGVRSAANVEAYSFPVRRDRETKFLNPEQFAMHMLPHVRRALILLREIPERDTVALEATSTHTEGLYPIVQQGPLSLCPRSMSRRTALRLE